MGSDKKSPCDYGKELSHGERQAHYDHPYTNFTLIGKAWGSLLHYWKKSDSIDIPPELVGCMLIAMKLVRQTFHKKFDNLCDIAGYAECLHMIDEEIQRLEKEK